MRRDLGLQRDRAAARSAQHDALRSASRLTLRGFIITDHQDRFGDFAREVGGWVASGDVKFRETIVDGGIEAAPQAFIDLLRGANIGKMLVRLG